MMMRLFHSKRLTTLVDSSYPKTKVTKQEQDVMPWNVVNCHLQWVVEIILVLFIYVFNGGVGHDSGEFDVPCINLT